MKNILLTVASIIIAVSISSCAKENPEEPIHLPETEVLVSQANWAVCNTTHLRMRAEASQDSKVIYTLWQDSVMEVLSRSINKSLVEEEVDYWYQVKYNGLIGWVFGPYLDFFISRPAALDSIGDN